MEENQFNDDGLPDAAMGPDEVGGILSPSSFDLDGDGLTDAVTANMDVDGDGAVDIATDTFDFDGDGISDIATSTVDLDGDGVPDVAAAVVLLDDGCLVDMLASADPAEAIWGDTNLEQAPMDLSELDAALAGTCTDYNFPGFDAICETHGTPLEDMELWDKQDDPCSCAVATTNMLFRSCGFDPSEEVIAEFFAENKIYDPLIGTYAPEQIAKVANDFAAEHSLPVHCENVVGFTVDQLEAWIDAGIRPLVGVDAMDLQSDRLTLNEQFGVPDSGHAIQVTGIVRSEAGEYVIINDPWGPFGAGQRVPMDRFLHAAEDMNFKATIMKPV